MTTSVDAPGAAAGHAPDGTAGRFTQLLARSRGHPSRRAAHVPRGERRDISRRRSPWDREDRKRIRSFRLPCRYRPGEGQGYTAAKDRGWRWFYYPPGIWQHLCGIDMAPDLTQVDRRFRVACIFVGVADAKPGSGIGLAGYQGQDDRYETVTRQRKSPNRPAPAHC